MKTVGIIGGHGPETTADFYMRVVRLSEKLENQRPPILLWNDPIPLELESALLNSGTRVEEYIPYLTAAAQKLSQGGAELLVMPCNTLHILEPQIRASVSTPFLSIIDATANAMESRGVDCVGLLATPLTIQTRLYQDAFESRGIESMVPSSDDGEVLGKIIADVCLGNHDDASEESFMRIMDTLAQRGVKDLLFACTDLQILKARHAECNVHDTTDILAQATMEVMRKD
ncbi:MAG: amino acid racemase [Candidatus Peribacteraceae bacterium]|jgi:aspartate racemase|nr:amino acid racemase [Candidatus Peribacteraceae bacterium]